MDKRFAKKLLRLNRHFYKAFAQPFSASRSRFDETLTCLLPYLANGQKVIDVGCGHGRLALLLDKKRSAIDYLGIDFSAELIRMARQQAKNLENVSARFLVVDIASFGWSKKFSHRLFDRAVMLAVLHHLPGFGLRSQVLGETARLLKPGGRLVLSTWQFLDSPRLERKIVDWSRVEIDKEDLDRNDYLLSWKRGGSGLRYCHLVEKTEIRQLAGKTGLSLEKTWRSGGREGNLSLYALLKKG